MACIMMDLMRFVLPVLRDRASVKGDWCERIAYSSLKLSIFSKSKDIFIMVVAVKING
jgi:hypothetical protein